MGERVIPEVIARSLLQRPAATPTLVVPEMISVSARNQFISGRNHRPEVRSVSRVMEFLKTQACAPQRTLKMPSPLAEAGGGSGAGRQSAAIVQKIQPGPALGTLTGKSNPVRPGQT